MVLIIWQTHRRIVCNLNTNQQQNVQQNISKPKYDSFFASQLMIWKDKSNKYQSIQKEAKTFACLIILYVLSHLSWAGKKVKKIAKKFTCIANKRTLRQNYLWRMKIFLTSEFWEIMIWNLNPKNLLHKFFFKIIFSKFHLTAHVFWLNFH